MPRHPKLRPFVRRITPALLVLLALMPLTAPRAEAPSPVATAPAEAVGADAGDGSAQTADLQARAAQGEPRAMLELALQLLDGDATQREQGIAWLRRAALHGDRDVQAVAWERIGRLQDDLLLRAQIDHDLTLDPSIPSAGAALFATDETDAAVELLIREAWLLNSAAERYLQILYEEPIEAFPRHDPRILTFFREAAREGIPTAQIFLGRIHLLGMGVPVDAETGREMLESAGHPQGYMELAEYALMLKDEPTAARYWLRAADEYQFAPALFNLGVRAQREGSPKTARSYFEKALARDPGHHGARLELARLLGQGGRNATDPDRAVTLLESVVEEADGRVRLFALANLGLIYLDGVHVPADHDRALALFREAEAGGLKSVRPYIDRIERYVDDAAAAPQEEPAEADPR